MDWVCGILLTSSKICLLFQGTGSLIPVISTMIQYYFLSTILFEVCKGVSFRYFYLISLMMIVLTSQTKEPMLRNVSITKDKLSNYIFGVEEMTIVWICGPSGLTVSLTPFIFLASIHCNYNISVIIML